MLESLLSTKKDAIVKGWIQRILDSYPEDAHKFLKGEKNRFANPVGQTFQRVIPTIFAGFVDDDLQKLTPALDEIVRIRAVQERDPSRALGFVLTLNQVVRQQLPGEPQPELSAELEALDRKVDGLLLTAFDIFMKCREKIYEIRVNEAKKRTAILLERWNRMSGKAEEE